MTINLTWAWQPKCDQERRGSGEDYEKLLALCRVHSQYLVASLCLAATVGQQGHLLPLLDSRANSQEDKLDML